MFQIRINPDMTVEIPQVGIFYAYQGKEYVVLSTATYQEQSTENGQSPWMPSFATFATILEIDDEGDDAGNPAITVKADELTEI